MHTTFTHALTRTPADTLADGLTTRAGAPSVALTLAQYERYLEGLRRCGLEVTTLPTDAAYPDGHYIEDVAVIYGELAFITAPGAAARRGEVESVRGVLPQAHQVRIQGDEALIEGGDVLFCADKHVLIGLSTRTNQAGAEQLRAALLAYDSEVRVSFVRVEGVLHLKTGMTELAPGVLLRSPQMKSDFRPDFAEVVTLPTQQEYAANVLPINGRVLVAAGFPLVAELAARHYQEVIALDMSEFEKMDGSLTCLSLRYRLG